MINTNLWESIPVDIKQKEKKEIKELIKEKSLVNSDMVLKFWEKYSKDFSI
jgi:hypothetical protein